MISFLAAFVAAIVLLNLCDDDDLTPT